MSERADPRIPVATARAAPEALPSETALLRVAAARGWHPPGCVCCTARPEAALALGRLFQARARGEVPWFGRVLAVTPDAGAEAALRTALGDALVRARFRAG